MSHDPEDQFANGALIGIFLMALLFLTGWHLEESSCQRKHNVADCVIKSDPFEPRETQ